MGHNLIARAHRRGAALAAAGLVIHWTQCARIQLCFWVGSKGTRGRTPREWRECLSSDAAQKALL